MFLKFNEIPNADSLFLDYLYNFEKVSEFYETDFRDNSKLAEKLKNIADSQKFREELSNLIRNQYNGFNVSDETLRNINKLSSHDCLAVVTGQQLGIFGGPLYTVYKIITAIKLAEKLNKEYSKYSFVPVFWLEADDHDFDEIKSINLINEQNELIKISYDIEKNDEDNLGSVGNLKIDEKINEFFNSTKSNLKETEFTPVILGKLSEFYSNGKTFNQAFKELLFWLFDKYGLIIFDPQDKNVKQLLIPVFKKEIADFRQHSETLVKISATLEESYHAQVKIRAVNLFHNYDGGRYLLEPVDYDFRLKRKRKKFTFDELNDLIEKHPESFSPNVLLRPICQDYLLPTAFYVAGPGEIAYFSQVIPLYDFYGVVSPVIYPRSSATLVEKNISGILDKYELDLQDVFKDPADIKKQVLAGVSDENIQSLFTRAETDIETAFEQLKTGIYEIDKTIGDSSSKYYQKIQGYLNELKGKTEQAHSKKHEITVRQIEKAILHLYPESNLQEREMNLFYYVNKYGEEFLKRIYDELEIDQFKHQVIIL